MHLGYLVRKGCNMTEDDPRPFGPDELASALGQNLLALNNAHARELSWLEPDHLVRLVNSSWLALLIGNAAGFLLAFDQDADYDAGNFLWFRARHARFVYIDRPENTEFSEGAKLSFPSGDQSGRGERE
jgi:predicted GNAT superfamily acetyltransferase